MKKTVLLFSAILTGVLAFGQSVKSGLNPGSSIALSDRSTTLEMSNEKTLLCQDTLRYAQGKEQILGTNTFFTFDIWQADNEGFSQTFLNSGSVNLRGVEFFGLNNAIDGTPSVTVTASVYNVNAQFAPTTLITSGTTVVTTTTAGYHFVTFAAPVMVTGNYAVVIQATSLGGIFTCYVNNAAPNQTYDETFARFKSTFYASSSNNWITIPAFTEIGVNNFEPLISPMVSYTLNAGFTATPTTTCLGTPVNFTNTTTPVAFLNNRMYNYQVFRTFFGTAPTDSTYVYDFDNLSPLAWSANTSYTYPAAGTYDALIGINGGFWNSCFDFATQPITINSLPTVTASATNTTICAGTSTTLNQGGANSYVWNNGLGAVISPSVVPTTTTTYAVTGTDANGCSNTASVVINVNPLDNATFAFSSGTLCALGANETPTAASPGVFSATPAGLNIVNTATGEIDVANSTAGTYVVSHTTTGLCPATATQSITVTSAPDATFNYAQTAYCTTASNALPTFGPGASAGTFSAAMGLTFVSTASGEINFAASMPGTYTISNNIAAVGVCPAASSTFNVTINEGTSAVVSGGGTQCGTGSFPITFTLSGSGPWDVTYSDGATSTTLSGQTTSPIVINATTSGTYTIPTVTQGTCSAVGSGSAVVLFNPNPTVAVSSVSPLCDNGSAVVLVANPSGGTFSGTSVSNGSFDPIIGAGTYTVDYMFTDANGCAGNGSTQVIVNAAPVVSLAPLTAVCIQGSSFGLTGGLPAGGVYSGNGVSNGNFDPATAGVGVQTVNYIFTDGAGCTSGAATDITVNDCAGIDEVSATLFTLYPNPVTENLTIVFTAGSEEITYTIVTEDGKRITAPRTISNAVSEVVSVREFAQGVYFLQVVSANGVSVQKFMVK